ncbi:type I-E CRISPR-associated protein Cse1/CasA [Methylococcus sp. EFPC2]|uniref:type I-E CRISPR-associated protein Cse1/CasA n=1 Tax=Methylococcus sp. EFPC2 TaxID=2812648 RepID=UPI001967564A|nr:type I-E CRISPR-associated protein Cse1/CasA [Methylococcus sp. EFPC2]QSA96788.1 type I-E CRISPR-associated protein Cse1/CasA [Methylococcus sp. EFPC2]
MNLMKQPWVPVRLRAGAAKGRMLTLEDLLCGREEWEIALPRDDLEMACLQLLISFVQVMFPPDDAPALRQRAKSPLSPEEFADGADKLSDWFDLDHPEWPFMQTRGVKADEATPIQKLLIGLPEGNNHAFFNQPGEIRYLGAPATAIALFHQAVNCPSFGGGFKGGLRGGAPITTLVSGTHLRETIWRNVLTRESIADLLPTYDFDLAHDQPTWVQPIKAGETFPTSRIGLLRGLFWQPAHVGLVRSDDDQPCQLLGGEPGSAYTGFFKEKFTYTAEGAPWSHPHGALQITTKKGKREERFLSFTTTAPAWTLLSEFVVPRGSKQDPEGSRPASAIAQFGKTWPRKSLPLLVGGYRSNQASVIERRHELFSLASGWDQAGNNLKHLVELALKSRDALRKKLFYVGKGNKDKGFKGLGVGLQQTGETLFFRRTERLIQNALADVAFDDAQFNIHRKNFVAVLADVCQDIFGELTGPYAAKPELVPIIAVARAGLGADLASLKQEVQADGR